MGVRNKSILSVRGVVKASIESCVEFKSELMKFRN